MQPRKDVHLGGGEPAVANRFLFEVSSVEIGIFREVSGLSVSVEAHKHTEGGENGYVHQFPHRMTWPNITLTAGLTNSDALFNWMSATSGEQFAKNKNQLKRTDAELTALTHDGTRLRSWKLRDAFVVKWTGPNFSVDSMSPLDEVLEIAHHGFIVETKKLAN